MYVAIKIRNSNSSTKKIKNALETLKLDRIHSCMVYPENKSNFGSLKKVKDWVTYGEINKDTLTKLLKKRGKANSGDLVDSLDSTSYEDMENMAEDLVNGDKRPQNLNLKLPFHLSPPSKGYKNRSKSFNQNGSLGDRGKEINQFLKRMI